MDQALKMKRFKTNGPMPNLLANELRKVMKNSPINYRRNNSDLKKLAASSRLDTSMMSKSRLDSSLIPRKKKKRRKTISPFMRLYNNNYKTKKKL